MSIKIESDLKEILQRFEQRFDKIDQKLDKLREYLLKKDKEKPTSKLQAEE